VDLVHNAVPMVQTTNVHQMMSNANIQVNVVQAGQPVQAAGVDNLELMTAFVTVAQQERSVVGTDVYLIFKIALPHHHHHHPQAQAQEDRDKIIN
jgi:translation elongation factor EF-G